MILIYKAKQGKATMKGMKITKDYNTAHETVNKLNKKEKEKNTRWAMKKEPLEEI